MLVDVVQLRHAGRKLPGDVVKAAPAVRGELRISTSRQGFRGGPAEPHQVAELTSRENGMLSYLLPSLIDARVTRLDASGLVLVGTEHRPEGPFPQAWWCRHVSAVKSLCAPSAPESPQ